MAAYPDLQAADISGALDDTAEEGDCRTEVML